MEQINVFSKNLSMNGETKTEIHSAVQRALDRFKDMISIVEVSLLDQNGPKGGLDKLCTLKVKHSHRGRFVIKSRGRNLLEAVHVACGIARNTLQRRHHKLKIRRNKELL